MLGCQLERGTNLEGPLAAAVNKNVTVYRVELGSGQNLRAGDCVYSELEFDFEG